MISNNRNHISRNKTYACPTFRARIGENHRHLTELRDPHHVAPLNSNKPLVRKQLRQKRTIALAKCGIHRLCVMRVNCTRDSERQFERDRRRRMPSLLRTSKKVAVHQARHQRCCQDRCYYRERCFALLPQIYNLQRRQTQGLQHRVELSQCVSEIRLRSTLLPGSHSCLAVADCLVQVGQRAIFVL